MNEETTRKEFEEWAEQTGPTGTWSYALCTPHGSNPPAERISGAREECVRTCTALAGDNFHDPYDCANAIRATIKEE